MHRDLGIVQQGTAAGSTSNIRRASLANRDIAISIAVVWPAIPLLCDGCVECGGSIRGQDGRMERHDVAGGSFADCSRRPSADTPGFLLTDLS